MKKAAINQAPWKRPLPVVVMILFALFGVYFIVSSLAATATYTKVWNSSATWASGKLTQTSVVNNAVTLAAASTATVTQTNSSDVALNRPSYASSTYQTGNKRNRTSYPAKYANDGINATSWISQASDPQWMYVDLGSQYTISQVKLIWGSGYATNFSIQISNDATSWSSIYSTSGGTGGVSDISGLNGTARYVRMYGTVRGGSGGYTISNFEVYGVSDRTNVALGKNAFANTTEAEGTAAAMLATRVTDGNGSTRWASTQTDPGYITVDLGQMHSISEVKLNWETAYGKAYIIEVSPDNSSWTTVYRTTASDGGIDDVTGLNATGRYVRMYGTIRATEWGYSLWEFEVYGKPQATTTYYSTGNILLDFDGNPNNTSGTTVNWTSLNAASVLPTGTGISYQARTSSDHMNWSNWTATTGSLTGFSARYIQIQANLTTTDTKATPVLNSLTLAYSVTTPDSAPTVSLTASPTSISAGASSSLTWNSTNATACTASGGWTGSKATAGTATTGALSANTTYTLSCTGPGGTQAASASVAVTPAPPVTTSGEAVPVGDYTNTTTGQSWKQIFVDDFTKNAATGTWGTTDAGRIVYTGDHGGNWREYPDGWAATNTSGKQGYSPAKVLSVHDGYLDFSLFADPTTGVPQGANPSPVLPNGTVYQTYGRYTARIRVVSPSTMANYHAAWLLWPQDESKWSLGGESDFPEFNLSQTGVNYFHHYDYVNGQTKQEYGTKTVDTTQWFTVTQEWAPGYIKYYLNGSLVGTAVTNVYQAPERWQLQTEAETSGYPNGHVWDKGTGNLQVDWVAVYSKN